ncbi:MAG: hypothetical protein HKO07_07665, partial [Pseudomonadales bacterium]|nr:hypothetical protein [Pseudomonadales bacterium]
MINVADNFWNIRGSFKVGGVLDIGTQCSLVRLANGRFVFLDAYTLSDEVAAEVASLTDNGASIDAIINLHPFHTLHVAAMHERYPNAQLYGTRRHIERLPELPWQPELCESAELRAHFAEDFDFSIPAGVDFISANPNLHFSSVLAM